MIKDESMISKKRVGGGAEGKGEGRRRILSIVPISEGGSPDNLLDLNNRYGTHQ